MLSRDPTTARLLTAADVTCQRGGKDLFAPVSFSVAGGTLLEVRGPNGIGKTTLLRAVAGLSRPSRGTIVHATDDDDRRQGVGYLGHRAALHAHLTIEENLRFALALEGRRCDDALIAASLERTGLRRVRALRAAGLSEGQRRRTSLARLVAAPRALWLLDEPDAGLDADGLSLLLALLNEQLAAGGAAIVTTHASQPLVPSSNVLGLERLRT